MNPPILSKLEFGSLLSYSPHGVDEASIKSKDIRTKIKRCDLNIVNLFSERLTEHLAHQGILNELFNRDHLVLIPVPRSSPTPPILKSGILWPGLIYCQAIQKAGVKCSIEPVLIRSNKVQKSAVAGKGERPSPKNHFDTLEMASKISVGDNVLLVDDFITRGATMLGAASRLILEFPNTKIMGFSVVRTMSIENFKQPLDPCLGTISLNHFSEPIREP